MRKFIFVASGVLCFLPLAGVNTLATAADLDWRSDRGMKDEPIYVPRYRFSWTGFYLGGNVGYSWGDTTISDADGGAFDGGADGFVVQLSGWQGGIQGGYNWQVDGVVFGIEADLGALGASESERTATAFAESEYGGYGALTARLGLVDDRWMFYLKGGLAFANIENRAGAINGGVVDPFDVTESDETRTGWTLGVGAEYAFHPNWSMKIEYMYMDFGEDTSSNFDGDIFRHENELHSVKVGVNYRFQPMQDPLR